MYYVLMFFVACVFVLFYRGVRLLFRDSHSWEILNTLTDENLSTWRSLRPLVIEVLLAYAVVLWVTFTKGKISL